MLAQRRHSTGLTSTKFRGARHGSSAARSTGRLRHTRPRLCEQVRPPGLIPERQWFPTVGLDNAARPTRPGSPGIVARSGEPRLRVRPERPPVLTSSRWYGYLIFVRPLLCLLQVALGRSKTGDGRDASSLGSAEEPAPPASRAHSAAGRTPDCTGVGQADLGETASGRSARSQPGSFSAPSSKERLAKMPRTSRFPAVMDAGGVGIETVEMEVECRNTETSSAATVSSPSSLRCSSACSVTGHTDPKPKLTKSPNGRIECDRRVPQEADRRRRANAVMRGAPDGRAAVVAQFVADGTGESVRRRTKGDRRLRTENQPVAEWLPSAQGSGRGSRLYMGSFITRPGSAVVMRSFASAGGHWATSNRGRHPDGATIMLGGVL